MRARDLLAGKLIYTKLCIYFQGIYTHTLKNPIRLLIPWGKQTVERKWCREDVYSQVLT